jgi:hypothetical protein
MLGHLDLIEQSHGALGSLACRVHIAEVHRQHHVFDDRERRQQLKELEDDAEVAAAPRGHLALAEGVDRHIADEHRACGGAVDAGDHVDQGRFAAAGLADDRHELAALDLEIDAFERGKATGGAEVGLLDLLEIDQVSIAVAGRPVGGPVGLYSAVKPVPKHSASPRWCCHGYARCGSARVRVTVTMG